MPLETALDNDSSDYGSDFSPDEEELLNELLASVSTTNLPTPAPTTTTTITVTTLADPLIVSDIEDYEVPHSVRFPRVLGRETWSPGNERVRRQQDMSETTRTIWSRSVTSNVDILAKARRMYHSSSRTPL